MKLKPGDRVDRFVVEKLIGIGGTATVYRVRHEQLGTLHALKILALQSDTIRERLLTEGQAQAALQHPNVVAVTDILDLDGQPGLLMEYIDGPSLEQALETYPFTLDDLEALFMGILDGVDAAHALGLVHRDLKLANVLLAPSPQGFVPKVTDFGLAKVLHNPSGTTATQTGVAMGTPGFMAPEQIRDAGKVDRRADLFSLGCMLYEMVSGERTFPGDQVVQIYIDVTRAKFIPIREHVPDLPVRFEQAIHGCLQRDPDDRIPDCTTLRQVLRGEIGWEGGPVPPPAASTPASVSRRERVLPVLLVGGSMAILLAVLGFAVLAMAVPLLLERPAPSTPALTPALPPPQPVDIQVAAPVREFETPTRHPSPRPAPAPAPEFEAPHEHRPPPRSFPLKLHSRPPSATIRVDGADTHRRTPYKLQLAAGPHRVEFHQRGYPPLTLDLQIGPSTPHRWCADFLTSRAYAGPCASR